MVASQLILKPIMVQYATYTSLICKLPKSNSNMQTMTQSHIPVQSYRKHFAAIAIGFTLLQDRSDDEKDAKEGDKVNPSESKTVNILSSLKVKTVLISII